METKEKVVNQEPVDGFSEVFGHFDEGRAGRGYTAEEGGFSVPAKSLKNLLLLLPTVLRPAEKRGEKVKRNFLSGPSRFRSPRQKEKEGQIFVTSLEQKSVLPSLSLALLSLAPLIPRNRLVGVSRVLVAVVGLFIYFNDDSRLVRLKPCAAGVLDGCVFGNLA